MSTAFRPSIFARSSVHRTYVPFKPLRATRPARCSELEVGEITQTVALETPATDLVARPKGGVGFLTDVVTLESTSNEVRSSARMLELGLQNRLTIMESDASPDENRPRSPLPCSERCEPCLEGIIRYRWPVEKDGEQCGAGLEQAEKFLAKTDITREGLVRCWLAVRKRLMKGGRDCGVVGQARKEAVSRYLEKKRRRELKFLAEELANEDFMGTVMEIDF